MSEQPPLLTPEQVSEYLQVSKRTVYDLRKRNVIPFIRVGNLIRFRRADLDAWVTASTIKAVK